jgi:hypothetical protein
VLGVAASRDAEDYAVTNLGWIGLSLRRHQWHLRLRPRVISVKSIVGLHYHLLDHGDRSAAISWYDDAVWNLERAESVRATISFVSYLLDRQTERYIDERTPSIRSRPSPRVAQHWDRVSGIILPVYSNLGVKQALRSVLNECFAGRWSIVDVPVAPLEPIVVVERGSGYPPLAPILARQKSGYTLDSLVDRKYFSWIDATYRAAANLDNPLFEDVDAIVEWPRLGEVRTRYWRMVVPLSRSAASCRMVTASGNDCSIDLRPEHVQEMSQVFGGLSGGHPQQHVFR